MSKTEKGKNMLNLGKKLEKQGKNLQNHEQRKIVNCNNKLNI